MQDRDWSSDVCSSDLPHTEQTSSVSLQRLALSDAVDDVQHFRGDDDITSFGVILNRSDLRNGLTSSELVNRCNVCSIPNEELPARHRLQTANRGCQPGTSVCFFKADISVRSPGKILILLHKLMFIGSKYPKYHSMQFENKITARNWRVCVCPAVILFQLIYQ